MRYVKHPDRPGERGRPLADLSVEYSEDHRNLLAFCAMRANRAIGAYYGYTVPPQELMAEGWWKCLRRLKVGELNRGTDHMILVMIRYGRDYHWRFSSYPWVNADHESSDAEQAIPATDDPFAAVDAADELAALLAGMDETLVAIGMDYYGRGLTFAEIGKRRGRSGERMRQLAAKFMEQARARAGSMGVAQ